MLKISIITIGQKMPTWVNQAVGEYKKRLQDGVLLSFHEIPLMKRGKTADLRRILEKEALMILAAIPQGARLIALDVSGESFSSEELANKIERLQHINSHLCFLIGGPEGLSADIVNRCDERWSLSKLTLPHTLARIFLLETLYRSRSILQNHPYHK